MAVYLRPTDQDKPLLGETEWQDIARYGFEISTIVGVLSYIIVQQGGEMINQGFCNFIRQLVNISLSLSLSLLTISLKHFPIHEH